jgi:protein-S-isoprenylcysteine O-methyltransferase Ste14
MMRKSILALVTIVALLAYLGLAILGWGGFAAFFSHSALIALTIVLFALSGVAILSGGNLSRGVREDRANRWVIVAFGLIGVLAAYLPAYTDRKGFWTLDGDAIRWLGVVLFAAGGALRIWPFFVLGHRFSGLVAIQPGHKLVTSGVYGVIRHPSYLGLLVNSLDGRSHFVRGSGYCSQCSSFRHSLRAFVLKSGYCVRSSAANTMYTAPIRHGSFPGSIEAGSCGRTILSLLTRWERGWSSRKHSGARWPRDAWTSRALC